MPRALVLGGYGLIGSAAMDALAEAGFAVTGMGRSSAATRSSRHDDWIMADIATVTEAGWRELLDGIDVVVNAAGALQDGSRDDLEAIHVTAVERLADAMRGGGARLVQISAAGVSAEASTAFFRSKARGDAAVAARASDWVILRPTLVLAAQAYGGTALLRAAAALPCVLPRVLPEAQVQTVHIDDLARAVVAAAQRRVPHGTVADITEPQVRPFPDLVRRMRRWLGVPPACWTPALPEPLLRLAGRVADLLGQLGWRSPLRTTALRALEDGIRGDPSAWEAAGGAPCRSLDQTLASLPAGRAERLEARMFLALPAAIGVLALFWLASGAIGLVRAPAALAVLEAAALPRFAREVLVLGGGVVDIALGAAILWRPWTRRAAMGMVVLSAVYLIGATLWTPWLWADPLGPMVKVLPGMALAALVWLVMEER